MLVLSRKLGERLMLVSGNQMIAIKAVEITAGRVRLGVDAPPEVAVYRHEIWNKVHGRDGGAPGEVTGDTSPAGGQAEDRSRVVPGVRLESAAEAAQAVFSSSCYSAVRQLTCGCGDGLVVISGRLPSFFQKQVAISLIAHHLAPGFRFVDAMEVARD